MLALSFAASARTVAVRAGCAALAYAAVVAVLLAASRAGVAAAVLGIVLWLWLRRDRVEAALLMLVATVPAAAVAGWAFTRPALVEDGASRADRVADGAWFGLILLVGAVLVGLGAREVGAPSARAGRPEARGALLLRGLALGVALVTLAGLVLNAGRIADEFRGEEVANDPGRFASLSSNNRLAWWGRGPERLRGGSARRRRREQLRGRPQALPRARLLGDAAAQRPAPVPRRHRARRPGALARARRRGGCCGGRRGEPPRGTERDAAAALAVALALWLVHALVDYPWDFVAVTGPAFFAAGALAAAGRPERRVRSPFGAVAVVAVALAAFVSVVSPSLAQRSVRDVNSALERGDLDAARDAAERARSLDPLSLEPLFARARVEEEAGDEAAALAVYRRADRAAAGEPGAVVRARAVRVPPRRPLLGVRAPEPRLHARPGRHAVDARQRARPVARLGERRELLAVGPRSGPGVARSGIRSCGCLRDGLSCRRARRACRPS